MNINIDLATIGQLILIVSSCCAMVNYLIIKPFQKALSVLNDAVQKIQEMLDSIVDNHHNMDKRLVTVETKIENIEEKIK